MCSGLDGLDDALRPLRALGCADAVSHLLNSVLGSEDRTLGRDFALSRMPRSLAHGDGREVDVVLDVLVCSVCRA